MTLDDLTCTVGKVYCWRLDLSLTLSHLCTALQTCKPVYCKRWDYDFFSCEDAALQKS